MNQPQTPNDIGYVIGDEDLDRLVQKYNIAIKKADDKRKQLTKAQYHKYRARAKKDLFFLSSAILGYQDLSPGFHGQFCKWIKDAFISHQYLLGLLPRAHFKTSVKTICHNIQCALPFTKEDEEYDEEPEYVLPYPMTLGTDIRILIVHEVETEASRFLFMIQSHFLSNPMLMALFPECIPSKGRLNKTELILPREGIFGEPTFDAKGVSAKQQGNHYNLISPDDIYGKEARKSDAESQQRRDFIDGIYGFMNNASVDKIAAVGTRYKYDDVYGHMMDRWGDKVSVYRRKVVELNKKTGKEEIVFPERMSPDQLEIIKKNKIIYYSEYLNDPAEIGEGFDPTWWRTFEWLDSTRIAVFDGIQGRPSVINIRDCYICFLIDPGEATGGFVIVAIDYWWRAYTIAAIPIDFPSPALVELIFRQAQKWHPSLVSIEADAAQHLLGGWVRSEMSTRKIFFQIHDYYTKKTAKTERIESLGQLYSACELFHNETQTELKQEFERFGKSEDIHILDAVAQLMDSDKDGQALVRKRGFPPGTYGIISSADAQHPYQNDIDPETGYSNVEMGGY